MNALKAVELLRKYNTCPDCESEKVGNGEGSVEIEEDVFKRKCKCGWMVKIKVK